MREDIEKRALEIGHYIVEKSATVRQTASVFRVSKSTVHKDVTEPPCHRSHISRRGSHRAECEQSGAAYSRRIGDQRKISPCTRGLH